MIGVNDHSYSPSSSISNTDGSILMDEGNLSYINNDGLVDWGGRNSNIPGRPMPKSWHHSTCCEVMEVNSSKGCCGCLDRGGFFVAKHFLCAPCSFGTVADLASSGEYGRCVCGFGLCLGTLVGFSVCGGAVLPCAVKVRRKAIEKYNIGESYGKSVVHMLCCPGAALIQVLMQVEEEEGGAVGMFGVWEDDAQIEDAGRYNLFDDRNYVSESVEGNTMKR